MPGGVSMRTMSAFFSAARTRAQSGGAVLDFFDAARQHSVALLRPGREAVPGIRIEHRDALPHPGEFPRQVADDGGFAYPTLPSPDRNNGHRLYYMGIAAARRCDRRMGGDSRVGERWRESAPGLACRLTSARRRSKTAFPASWVVGIDGTETGFLDPASFRYAYFLSITRPFGSRASKGRCVWRNGPGQCSPPRRLRKPDPNLKPSYRPGKR